MSISSLERYRKWARKIEDDPRFHAELLRLAFADDLARLLEARGIKRTELAEKLGTNRGYITRILDTEYNLTIETMARIAHALGAQISLHMTLKDSDACRAERPSRTVADRVRHSRRHEDDTYPLPGRTEVPVVADKPRRGKR